MTFLEEAIITGYFRSTIKNLNFKNNDVFVIYGLYDFMPLPENIEQIFDLISTEEQVIFVERISFEFYIETEKPNYSEIKDYFINATDNGTSISTNHCFKTMIEIYYPQYIKCLDTILLLI